MRRLRAWPRAGAGHGWVRACVQGMWLRGVTDGSRHNSHTCSWHAPRACMQVGAARCGLLRGRPGVPAGAVAGPAGGGPGGFRHAVKGRQGAPRRAETRRDAPRRAAQLWLVGACRASPWAALASHTQLGEAPLALKYGSGRWPFACAPQPNHLHHPCAPPPHSTTEQHGVAALTLACPDYIVPKSGFVWLNAPGISRLEWHPFTYYRGGEPGAPTLQLSIKAYSSWSLELVRRVQESGAGVELRLQGPYPEGSPAWQPEAGDSAVAVIAGGRGRVRVVVCMRKSVHARACTCARTHKSTLQGSLLPGIYIRPPASRCTAASSNRPGGIGITEALSVLSEADSRRPAAGAPLLLLWVARHPAELLSLAPRVVRAARAKGFALTPQIFYTGPREELVAASEARGLQPPEAAPGAQPACAVAAPGSCAAAPAATPAPAPLAPALALCGSARAQALIKLAVHMLSALGE